MLGRIMTVSVTTAFAGLLVALPAGWLDWKARRIPNWLTASGMAAGVAGNVYKHLGDVNYFSRKGSGVPLALVAPTCCVK